MWPKRAKLSSVWKLQSAYRPSLARMFQKTRFGTPNARNQARFENCSRHIALPYSVVSKTCENVWNFNFEKTHFRLQSGAAGENFRKFWHTKGRFPLVISAPQAKIFTNLAKTKKTFNSKKNLREKFPTPILNWDPLPPSFPTPFVFFYFDMAPNEKKTGLFLGQNPKWKEKRGGKNKRCRFPPKNPFFCR